MARTVASTSFRPRRDVGSMYGARSSGILEFIKWTVQVRRAAITVRHTVHFNSQQWCFLLLRRSKGAAEVIFRGRREQKAFSRHALPKNGRPVFLVLTDACKALQCGRVQLPDSFKIKVQQTANSEPPAAASTAPAAHHNANAHPPLSTSNCAGRHARADDGALLMVCDNGMMRMRS